MIYEVENRRIGYITKDNLYGEVTIFGSGKLSVSIPDDAEILPDCIVDSLIGLPANAEMSVTNMEIMQRAIEAKRNSSNRKSGAYRPKIKIGGKS